MKRPVYTLLISLSLVAVAGIGIFVTEKDTPTSTTKVVPSISYLDIFNNQEFKQRLVLAVKSGDDLELKTLQQKAEEIAHAAGLPQEQMALIRGQRGLNFMIYRAKREMFEQAFVYRYNNLMDIRPLEQHFPEAQDLYQKALETVSKRDALIVEIAKTLANGDDYQGYLEQARAEWLKRQKEQQYD